MLTKIIATPIILITSVLVYLTLEDDYDWAIYIVPNILMLAVIYVLNPQIDFWWAKRHTPEMSSKLRALLEQKHPFYSRLSSEAQKRFRDRVVLYMMGNEFMPQKMETVPPDLQGMIASGVVQLTFGLDDFLLPAFEHIIVYPRPFPSPQYPTNFHTSEIFVEDKVILFAIEQLIPGTLNPTKHYNICLHEYIRAYLHMYKNNNFSDLDESTWESLEKVSGWSKEHIFKYINRPDVQLLPVSICHFFIFGEKFKEVLPDVFERYQSVFNFNPTNHENPVVDIHKIVGKK